MATRFKRFRAYFPGKICPLGVCGHSHFVCLALKLGTLLLLGCGGLALSAASARADSFVEFDYNIFSTRARGTIFLELYDDRPLTTANFLQYVNVGLYNNTLMNSLSISPGTLSGGGYYPSYLNPPPPINLALNPNAKVDLDGNPFTPNPTIANEFNNSPLRSNLKGTISMFHDPSIQNSAASNQFFFNLIDNSQLLDGSTGQAVFGNVVGDGMSLIDVYANQLPLINMNPDSDGNGVRDTGLPFGTLPVIVNQSQGTFLPLILSRAKAVDYLGSGATTDVPAGGLTFTNNDAFIDTGAVFTGTGALTVGVGRTLGVREGYVVNRSIVNHGTLAPGLSLGVMGIDSTYFQFSDGTLAIQLAGTTADTQYDRLITSSTAFLAGRLQVSFLNSFSPVAGNSFTVLTAQSIVGNFTSFDLPQLSTGLLWNIGQSSNAVTLTVVTDAGDFNKDGIVDARDYIYWRKTNGTATNYQLWRSNLGNRSGGVFGAGADAGGLTIGNVPEPSAGFLVLMAGLLFTAWPRRG